MIKARRTFYTTADVVYRNRSMNNISQTELAKHLGYKNGQYISNLERGMCGIPASKIVALASKLDIDTNDIIRAQLEDYKLYLHNSVISARKYERA